MWNEPSEERLSQIPRLYETEMTPLQEKLIYLHFFIGDSDWYVAEYDGVDLFFGYAILGGEVLNAEWGFMSLSEMKDIEIGWLEINCETEDSWRIRRASEVDKISKT